MVYHPYLPSSFTERAATAAGLAGLAGNAADDPFHRYLYASHSAVDNMLYLPLPKPRIVPISTPKAITSSPILLLRDHQKLTYSNLAIWLAEQPPAEIIARRRHRSEGVMQRFLDEHHGGRLPTALESWAYVYEYMLNSQDPVYPLVTTREALKALRDPLVIRALGWGKVPDDIIAA